MMERYTTGALLHKVYRKNQRLVGKNRGKISYKGGSHFGSRFFSRPSEIYGYCEWSGQTRTIYVIKKMSGDSSLFYVKICLMTWGGIWM